MPFEPGHVLCSADGYDPTYTWTGTVNGEDIGSQAGSTYTLVEGDFDITCTATVDALTCTSAAADSFSGTALGKCQMHCNAPVTMLMLTALSVG